MRNVHLTPSPTLTCWLQSKNRTVRAVPLPSPDLFELRKVNPRGGGGSPRRFWRLARGGSWRGDAAGHRAARRAVPGVTLCLGPGDAAAEPGGPTRWASRAVLRGKPSPSNGAWRRTATDRIGFQRGEWLRHHHSARPSSGITIWRTRARLVPVQRYRHLSKASSGIRDILIKDCNIFNSGYDIHIKTDVSYIQNVTVDNVRMRGVRSDVVVAGGDNPDGRFSPRGQCRQWTPCGSGMCGASASSSLGRWRGSGACPSPGSASTMCRGGVAVQGRARRSARRAIMALRRAHHQLHVVGGSCS
jgi:hypothetical protein